jgi:hypothetical protein
LGAHLPAQVSIFTFHRFCSFLFFFISQTTGFLLPIAKVDGKRQRGKTAITAKMDKSADAASFCGYDNLFCRCLLLILSSVKQPFSERQYYIVLPLCLTTQRLDKTTHLLSVKKKSFCISCKKEKKAKWKGCFTECKDMNSRELKVMSFGVVSHKLATQFALLPVLLNIFISIIFTDVLYAKQDFLKSREDNYTAANSDKLKNPLPSTAKKDIVEKVIFGTKLNQVQSYFGVSARLESLYIVNLSYSQPNDFFRLEGRQNFELVKFADRYDLYLAGLSQDVINSIYRKSFVGLGLGIFIANKTTDRVGSNFTFSEKVFLGFRFGNQVVELLYRHFSNGSVTNENSGFDFVGLTLSQNF